MRAFIIGFAAGAALVSPLKAAPVPTRSDDAALMQIEALQDRWQGRHHYLYDNDNRTSAQTTGAGSMGRDCNAPVRLKRSDGTTVVKRLNRCD